MVLAWEPWRAVARVQKAETNSPSMKSGEKGPAVHLLQAALIMNDCDVPDHGLPNDNFLGQTAAAVRKFQEQQRLDRDTGIAGKQVITRLDSLNDAFYKAHAGGFGARLAIADAPRALTKVQRAIDAISALQTALGGLPVPINPQIPMNVAQDALRVHFRLLMPGVTGAAAARPATAVDLTQINLTFRRLAVVIGNAGAAFTDGIPVTGVQNPAEAVPNSERVLFGPYYRDFDAPQTIRPRAAGQPGARFAFGARIGPESRAAIVIHEGMHSVDASLQSGAAANHISEFDPNYDLQSANQSILNPSSYAGFAAHIVAGRDPNPRFGLGDAQDQ